MRLGSTWVAFVWLAAGAALGCSDGDDEESAATCGAPTCSEDGYRIERVCGARRETVTECLRDEGKLCESAACVEPWRYGSPSFGRCENEPLATPESLADKAAFYDEITPRLHIHPKVKQAMAVVLKASPTDPALPAVAQEQATWQDVEVFVDDNHNGIWSGFYLASQAFRYAVTRDPRALDTIRLLLEGDGERFSVTGVPGVYSRGVHYPDVPGHACPLNDEAYIADPDKGDKPVAVRDDGCAWVVDYTTKQWRKTDRCGLDWLKGGCFVDNVSKDVTLGHVFSLATVWKLVDHEDVRATIAERLRLVGEHLMQNQLTIHDWDGRVTGSGELYALALDDYPGFNAAMALDYLVTTAAVSGSAELRGFYENCLLQRAGENRCLEYPVEKPRPYTEWLPESHLFQTQCRDNFCSHSMQNLNLHQIAWFERDPAIREVVQQSFDVDSMRAPGQPRAGLNQRNTWFDFMWAAQKRLGPGSDGPAFEAVESGICELRQFPARHQLTGKEPLSRYTQTCENRGRLPAGEIPLPVSERCADFFVWWHSNPYELTGCLANERLILPPQGFLLPYWMGRYFGFIDAEM